jgi:hypothetical protein
VTVLKLYFFHFARLVTFSKVPAIENAMVAYVNKREPFRIIQILWTR